MKLRELVLERPVDNEFHRHVVVASIAALQTFHRGTLVSIIDSGDEYRERAAEAISEKFLMKDALGWLRGQSATFGELVAHTAPCNSVSDLLSWLGKLLACDMRVAVAEAINPHDRRNRIANPVKLVANTDEMLSRLADAFRLRHIFAHEAAPNVEIDADYCRLLFEAVTTWIRAVDGVLWTTVYTSLPLTTREMNDHGRAEVMSARKGLADAMRVALKDARQAGSADWLRRNHRKWKAVVSEWSDNTYATLQGTMWPPIKAADLAEAVRKRTKQVGDWTQNSDRNL